MASPDIYPFVQPDVMNEIVRRLRGAKFVQIIGHINPDGDCIGSMLALHLLLAKWGIAHAMAAHMLGASGYDQIAGFDLIKSRPDANPACDLIVYLDTSTSERGFEDWKPGAPIVNIDHHASNTRFGEINWIEPRFAATGEMVYHLIRRAGETPTPAMADCLLLAIMTDTGSFRYGNTGANQHRVAAELIDAGASPGAVSRVAYDSQPLQSLQITGHVLASMRIEAAGRLAWSELRMAVSAMYGGPDNTPENLVSLLRSVRGVQVCLLFHELEGGRVRVNFRSDGSVDVSKLAAKWGGGGHECAAGLMMKNSDDYEKSRNDVISETLKTLETKS